jgi:hypothetical protein
VSSAPSTIRRRWPRRLAIGVGIVIVLAIAVPFSYIHLVDKKAPPKLALTPAQAVGTTDTGGGVSVTGTWNVDGSARRPPPSAAPRRSRARWTSPPPRSSAPPSPPRWPA